MLVLCHPGPPAQARSVALGIGCRQLENLLEKATDLYNEGAEQH